MILIEKFTHNGKEFRKTSTDSELTMLRKKGTNIHYNVAVDVIDSKNEYDEVPLTAEEIERRKKRLEISERKKQLK